MREDHPMSDDIIIFSADDIFAWDGEQIEREAVPLAMYVRTDVAAAVAEYEAILARTASPAYTAMVAARAAGLVTFEVLEHGEWPLAIVTTVSERLQAFIVGAKARLQYHSDRQPSIY